MKLIRKVGATSEIWQIFIADSSSTTGAGLTALAYNSGSLTVYWHRDTDTTATTSALVDMTVGTFTSYGFKKIDDTNMPGWYQFCPPNAALASGAKSVAFLLKGATNMAPLPIEVDLDVSASVLAAPQTESYSALHAVPTATQAMLQLISMLQEVSISGTTLTAKKIDGSTTSMTFTTDSSTAPTSLTRAS